MSEAAPLDPAAILEALGRMTEAQRAALGRIVGDLPIFPLAEVANSMKSLGLAYHQAFMESLTAEERRELERSSLTGGSPGDLLD